MSEELRKRQLRSIKKWKQNRELRVQLKEQKAQRQAERADRRRKPPRRREWGEDDDDAHTWEKIRPAARVERGRPVAPPPEPTPQAAGTVIEVRSGDSLVMLHGRVVRAVLPPGGRTLDPNARSPLAVGDRVYLEPLTADAARIVAVAPRRSALSREIYDPNRDDAARRSHVLAANIDQAVVVCSPAEPPFRPRLIDRYLVAASRDALPAVICLNKTDLDVPHQVEASLRGYSRLGVEVLRTSAVTGHGIDLLRRCLAAKASLFSGHSGVGKSSLLNTLEPGLALRVGTVTQSTPGQGKGRHSTSSARLIPLSMPDTFVVDTPGIRAYSLRGTDPRSLAGYFADIAALADGCEFRDCLHRGEPACAVAAAAEDDPFLRARLQSYRGMLRELT
jgi:ribosome biogenesis GTPase